MLSGIPISNTTRHCREICYTQDSKTLYLFPTAHPSIPPPQVYADDQGDQVVGGVHALHIKENNIISDQDWPGEENIQL